MCENNQTIALTSHASKIMLEIIQFRMEMNVEREMPEEQACFMKHRGTRDQIANANGESLQQGHIHGFH